MYLIFLDDFYQNRLTYFQHVIKKSWGSLENEAFFILHDPVCWGCPFIPCRGFNSCVFNSRIMASQEMRLNHTIYINNLNEKIKKDGMVLSDYLFLVKTIL